MGDLFHLILFSSFVLTFRLFLSLTKYSAGCCCRVPFGVSSSRHWRHDTMSEAMVDPDSSSIPPHDLPERKERFGIGL